MIRQIAAVLSGFLVSVLLAAGFGYFFYRHSERLTEVQLGEIARFVGDPLIALVAGICVGLLADSRPSILAGVSLLPSALRIFFIRQLDPLHFLLLALLMIAYLAIGMFSAQVTFRLRRRSKNAFFTDPVS